MTAGPQEFRDALLSITPNLRAFSRSLCKARDVADDLVQDTLLKAWEKQDSLKEADRLLPWALTIMKNIFRAQLRRGKCMFEDIDGHFAEQLTDGSTPHLSAELQDLANAVDQLPNELSEVLILIFVNELTYEEAARLLACPVGTVKSRVSRARGQLTKLLGVEAGRNQVEAAVLPEALQQCLGAAFGSGRICSSSSHIFA